jgi:class 3 adenylate cyclase
MQKGLLHSTSVMTIFISLDDPNLKQKVEQLKPTDGYVLMVDLVGSTALKQGKEFKDWVAYFVAPFKNIQNNLFHGAMKVVGDMAMYWFPESAEVDPAEIMTGLMKLQREFVGGFKMAFVRCRKVYQVSFHEKVPEDVYGLDIDLTARLLAEAKPGQILMNSACREEIVRCMKGLDFSNEIEGPQRVPLKGIKDPTDIFLWRMPA